MNHLLNQNNNSLSRRPRKRTRQRRTNHHMTIPKAALLASLLWVVALTTYPSPVKAFVVTGGDRPSHSLSFTLNKQTCVLPSTPPASIPLYVSTLAEVDRDSTSKTNDLFSREEQPEDVLDLSKLPLLLVPKNGQTLANVHVPEEEEVLEWAERYTTVEGLREHFGTNHNKLWGDLQASTARRLYKTLLPRALLELSKVGKLHPQDLAPLAYQARVAAKLYARERCTVPARLAATLFDGFRQWIKYGKFQAHGMTYDQLWEKYAEKILQETEAAHALEEEECDPFHHDDDDLSEQVCRKILERACVSNEGVDALTLKGKDWADDTELQPDQRALLEQIRTQLEEDMVHLLLPSSRSDTLKREEKLEMPELHGRTRTRDRIKQGKFRLVKGLQKQRRLWKLQNARKKLLEAEREKPWKSRSKPWLSRSRHDDDDETVALSDDEDE